MTQSHTSDVIIIGAGLSGLAAAQELRTRNIQVTILEASSQVADPWRARHPELQLNVHKHFTRLPGNKGIRTSGPFAPRDAVVDYLTEYADALAAEIQFNTAVVGVHFDDRVWHVETNKGLRTCAHLIVATGRERQPHAPTWPGMDRFGGSIIHAADFADPTAYDGKNVLVIGAGNSGTDILNHLSRSNPDQVWVSVRHGPAILPSKVLGFPLHRLAGLFTYLPNWALDPIFSVMQRFLFGDLRRYNLPRHTTGGGSRMLKHGVAFALDNGFVAALKSGRFAAVSAPTKFTASAVELADGKVVNPDVVICATGYRSGLSDLFSRLEVLDTNGYPHFPMGQEDCNHPGLWFTGYGVLFQGYFHAASIGAVRIANSIAAQLSDDPKPK